jgi:hypothetical protein
MSFLGFCPVGITSFLRIFLFCVLVFGVLVASSFDFSFSYLYVRLDNNKNRIYHIYLNNIIFWVFSGWRCGFGSFFQLLHFVFIHYCSYILMRLKTSFYDTLSISIEILTGIVSFGFRSTQANFLSVWSRSRLICDITVIPLTFARALCISFFL